MQESTPDIIEKLKMKVLLHYFMQKKKLVITGGKP